MSGRGGGRFSAAFGKIDRKRSHLPTAARYRAWIVALSSAVRNQHKVRTRGFPGKWKPLLARSQHQEARSLWPVQQLTVRVPPLSQSVQVEQTLPLSSNSLATLCGQQHLQQAGDAVFRANSNLRHEKKDG